MGFLSLFGQSKRDCETVKKNTLSLKTKPNLLDYNQARQKFDWQDYNDLLDYSAPGKINMAFNVIDRHALGVNKNKTALIWTNDKGQEKKLTFFDLYLATNKFASLLKKHKVRKGDRVFVFLPQTPELFIAFLGALKVGAIGSTMFQAFGPEGLRDRLQDSEARFLVTDAELVSRVDEIKGDLPKLEKIIITSGKVREGEINYQKEIHSMDNHFEIVQTESKDPAFMLYTSGTTGKPTGVVHAHGALLQMHLTAKWVLDLQDQDIYWCTADPGWITGIVYKILSNWSLGVTSLVYDGRFDPHKWYGLIEKYKVSVWYTAPTAIRLLMKAGKETARKYDFSSLRHLCSVGEALNPEAIRWGVEVFGKPFHDTWWQTECGAIMITNYPAVDIKVGSMGKPFPGIQAAIIDEKGEQLGDEEEGELAIKPPWPAMMHQVWGNKDWRKSKEELDIGHFDKGWYCTGDRAKRDKDGYYWFIGRSDDVIKTSGERVGPFEVESTLMEHKDIAEAAVIGKPDSERGEIIKAFVVLKPGIKGDEKLIKDLQELVKKRLAGHAYPKEVEFRSSLPKNRSGKIMRRMLKAEEMGEEIKDKSMLEEE